VQGLPEVAAIAAIALTRGPPLFVTVARGDRALDAALDARATGYLKYSAGGSLRQFILPSVQLAHLAQLYRGRRAIWVFRWFGKIVLVDECFRTFKGVGFLDRLAVPAVQITLCSPIRVSFVSVELAIDNR